jgi:hypothetical protein
VVDHRSEGFERDARTDGAIASWIFHGILEHWKFHAQVIVEELRDYQQRSKLRPQRRRKSLQPSMFDVPPGFVDSEDQVVGTYRKHQILHHLLI